MPKKPKTLKDQLAKASQPPRQPQQPAPLLDTSSPPSKGKLLKLDAKDSSGAVHSYMIDGVDLLNLLNGSIPFIEIQTRETPGLRFVTLRYE